ncbi:sensor histidine kinase [Ilumatobacter nonamiensis]|uniref:sensor histidine kinase n=1 Tax=Ilumatobacter nonamiensis TaxID=467093 RepID=UPI000349A305|nr:ATP-binding protein [Ilumatobacter nonamiensis]
MIWLIVVVSLLGGAAAGVLGARRWMADAQSPDDSAAADDLGTVLRMAADELDLGVIVVAADGSSVYRNRAASAMHGTHVGIIVDDHLSRALDAARGGSSTDDLVELHGPPRVALQLVAEPMPNGYAVATVEDVSERSRINMMRTDFVANISHELKTPVGAIAVLAEALFGETDREVIDRVAGRMVDESHRAVRAIDDLLELSRIEAGRLLEETVALDDVVQAAIARGKVVDSSKNVSVTAIECSQRVLLRADGRQLLAALGNLVENAVKYSEDDGTVQVRTRIDDHGIEVLVADQGIGIPARDLERVFERFYRVDRARSRETGGSGLGLSIVRHVASNHGGEVLLSSEEGEGSTFVLRLPLSLVLSVEEGSDTAGSADTAESGHSEHSTPDTIREQHQ